MKRRTVRSAITWDVRVGRALARLERWWWAHVVHGPGREDGRRYVQAVAHQPVPSGALVSIFPAKYVKPASWWTVDWRPKYGPGRMAYGPWPRRSISSADLERPSRKISDPATVAERARFDAAP